MRGGEWPHLICLRHLFAAHRRLLEVYNGDADKRPTSRGRTTPRSNHLRGALEAAWAATRLNVGQRMRPDNESRRAAKIFEPEPFAQLLNKERRQACFD